MTTKEHKSRADFASFAFSPALSEAISEAGFKQPTDIQLEAIPSILEGRDVLARADTGSGKTAAFILPLIEHLSSKNIYAHKEAQRIYNSAERARDNSVQVLILVPTRELAIQIRDVVEQFSKHIKPAISCHSVFGGVKINPQMMSLRGGADVLVATPGRLLDLIDQNAIKLNRIKALVIDEVDRLMKGDFADEFDRIRKKLPNKRQNLMFSATFPDTIRAIVRDIMRNPEVINLDENFQQVEIDQHVVTVNHDKKNDLLAYLLNENGWKQVLIFCSAKRTCDNLVKKLEKRDIQAVAMHGDKEQTERAAALRNFKAGENRVLIATDVAARGIDIEFLPCVINYDLPRSPNDYIHRIGRTARAGQSGQAISLIAHHEYQHFGVIEKHNDIELPREQVEGFEADNVAPPMPKKNGTKRKLKAKNKKRLSKKQKARLAAATDKGKSPQVKPSLSESSSQPKDTVEKKTTSANAGLWGKPK